MTMYARTFTMLGTGVVATIMFAQGCDDITPNPRHCNNNEGDEYCNREFGDGTKPLFCEHGGTTECRTSDYGCVEQQPADMCYSPCGGRSTIDENGACVMVEDSSSGSSEGTDTEPSTNTGTDSESSSTTGPMPCSPEEPCTDVAAPYCNASRVCVPCNEAPLPADADTACAMVAPQTPVCLDGTCVQCTPANPSACENPTPVCDSTSNECVLCTAHDQCGPAACNLYTGACLPADAVVHVGGNPMVDTPNFPSLNAAVISFDGDGAQGTILVHPGMPDYDEAVTVDGGRVLAFLAAEQGPGINPPQWSGNGEDQPQLVVTDATVLMDGLQLSGNGSSDVPGLRVSGGRAWLDRSRVVQNTGGGILAEMGAELTVRNCFVGGNVADVDAIVLNGSTLDMLYTTVVAGNGDLGETSTSLTCAAPLTVDIRNSILVAVEDEVPEIDCAGATITFTASENATMGEGNDTLGNLEAGWFVDLTTDFHLGPAAPIDITTTAQWQDGDPATDIDGDSRDMAALDYAGADVPQ